MDIIFNFGEHYFNDTGSAWTDVIITIIGGFIGFGTALFFYYRQNQADKKRDESKIQEEQKDTLHFFKQLIDDVVSTIEKQGEKCIEFKDSVTAMPTEIHQLRIIASKEIDRLHLMDPLKIFYAFRNKFKKEEEWIKEVKELYMSLDFIQGHLNEIVFVFEQYRDSTYQKQLRYKSLLEELVSYMTQVALELKRTSADYTKDAKYHFINRHILKFRELADAGTKLADYNEKFLYPLLTETLKDWALEFFGLGIMNTCKNARVLLHDIKVDAEDSAKSIGDSPELMKKSKDVLIRISQQI